jgi:hypothetical protein
MQSFNRQYEQLLNELNIQLLPSRHSILSNFNNAINEDAQPPEHPKYGPKVVRSLINAVRKYVIDSYPYFGYLLQQMQIIITLDVPTMAVDNNRNLYINPDFLLELGKGYIEITETGFKIIKENNPIAFVIAHEVYHIFNETFDRERGRTAVILVGDNKRPVNLWNIATDYEMNYRLQYTYGLEPMGEAKNFMMCDSDGVTIIPVFFTGKRYMVKGSTAERLYALMLNDCKEIEKLQKENPVLKPGKPDPSYKFKVGDKIMIKGSNPPDWQEVTGILPNGDLETKPISQKPVFPERIEVTYR